MKMKFRIINKKRLVHKIAKFINNFQGIHFYGFYEEESKAIERKPQDVTVRLLYCCGANVLARLPLPNINNRHT